MNAKKAKRARKLAYTLLVLDAELAPEVGPFTKDAVDALGETLKHEFSFKERRRAASVALRRIGKKFPSALAPSSAAGTAVTP